MRDLITADLHLTDREKDNYRWDLFPWIERTIKEKKINRLLILGDITDMKDKHSSVLTNNIVNAFQSIAKLVPILIIPGNHDFVNVNNPFFRFLDRIEGINFFNEPTVAGTSLFLPHSKNPTKDWEYLSLDSVTRIFIHQCVLGSAGAQGYEMEHGLEPSYFKSKGSKAKVVAGDIHVPQVVGSKEKGQVEYVGSPYPINFGDHYKTRLLIMDEKEILEEVHFPSIQKLSIKITNPSKLKLQRVSKGDQISVKLLLEPAEFCHWSEYKKECAAWAESKGLTNVQISMESVVSKTERTEGAVKAESKLHTPELIMESFGKKEKLDPSILKRGVDLL